MNLRSVYHGPPSLKMGLSTHGSMSHLSKFLKVSSTQIGLRNQRVKFGIIALKSHLMPGLKKGIFREPSLPSKNRGTILCASDHHVHHGGSEGILEPQPSHDKSCFVPLYGLTHQLVGEERRQVAAACGNQYKGSCLWVLAPLALILSSILPRLYIAPAIKAFLKDNNIYYAAIGTSLSLEAPFYIGLAIFLLVTQHVQQPYLQFNPNIRWGLITGFRGHLTSAFLAMGFKLILPLFALRLAWELLNPPARVALLSLVVNCVAQLAFETSLYKLGWSCWPLVPIIFEVYRLYQLTETVHHIEVLILSKPQRYGSIEHVIIISLLFCVTVILRVLAVVCLWSLITFLMRIFPSRPVP